MSSAAVAAPPPKDAADNTKKKDGSTSTSLSGAMARTAARAAALYLSRPVRLFRPQKVSAWTSLRGRAKKDGMSLSPAYLTSIIKHDGWSLFRHHLLPPLLVNTVMGTLLFTTYTASSAILKPLLPNRSSTTIAALSGATAGAVHGVAGAPLDNVARLLEGGSTSWREAWKQAFRGNLVPPLPTLKEGRDAKLWIWEWQHMAGRGWHGWKWGFTKDVTGFSIFFAIFDLSRRLGNRVANSLTPPDRRDDLRRPGQARAAHGIILVSGGVVGGLAYEAVGRPWDIARELVNANASVQPPQERLPLQKLFTKTLREKGISFFFRPIRSQAADVATGAWYWNFLPTLARVGPWGIAFLVWEGVGGTVIG